MPKPSISVDSVMNGYVVRARYSLPPEEGRQYNSREEIYVAYNGEDLDTVIEKLKKEEKKEEVDF